MRKSNLDEWLYKMYDKLDNMEKEWDFWLQSLPAQPKSRHPVTFWKVFFQRHNELDGYLYIGYPIIGTVDGAYPIDSLWVSPDKGLVIFNLIEGKNIDGYEEAQDDCANKIEAKLRGYRQLVNKRKLCVEINVITYAPALMRKVDCDEDYPLRANDNDLLAQIETLNWNNSGYYEALVSVLQAISTIRKGKNVGKPQSPNPEDRS